MDDGTGFKYIVIEGTAKVRDFWNFDWKLMSYILGKLGFGSGNGRSWYGQWKTMAGSGSW